MLLTDSAQVRARLLSACDTEGTCLTCDLRKRAGTFAKTLPTAGFSCRRDCRVQGSQIVVFTGYRLVWIAGMMCSRDLGSRG